MKKLTATLAVTTVVAGGALVFMPATAQAETSTDCAVSDATLTWGVKESFRSYISGTIANGSWETSDGASYETPEFHWTGGTGSYDPESQNGTIEFTGGINFTGHGGILDMTMANPTLQITDGAAVLALDMTSNDVDGSVSIDEKQVPAINIDGELTADDTTITLDAAPTTLSEQGAPAFGDFYEAGEAADPVTISAALDCPVAAAEDEPAADDTENAEEVEPISAEAEEDVADTGALGWVIAAILAAVLIVGGVIAAVVAKRRKKTNVAEASTATETSTQSDATDGETDSSPNS